MKERNFLETIFSKLNNIIVVEDNLGNICYQNHPEINFEFFVKDFKSEDEFFDKKNEQWYKFRTDTFDFENKTYTLKIYNHITKMKNHQLELEVDGKTGLLRNEFFKDKVEYLSQIDKQIVFVLLDIDYFKQINDYYGHQEGDRVLSQIGSLIKSTFRSSDLFGRFGGDEIALALIGIELDVAVQKLENLRQFVNNIVLNGDNTQNKVSISVGCTQYDNNLSYEENLTKVDEILYFSKENGRNQVNSPETIDLSPKYDAAERTRFQHKH